VCAFVHVQKQRSLSLKMLSKELNDYMKFVLDRMKEKVCSLCSVFVVDVLCEF